MSECKTSVHIVQHDPRDYKCVTAPTLSLINLCVCGNSRVSYTQACQRVLAMLHIYIQEIVLEYMREE